ncbi:MAG: histidine kinase [Actinomycetota bacterium]
MMNDPAFPAAASQEETLRAEIARQQKIINALMDRVERGMSARESDFGQFQAAILLEGKIRERTAKLKETLEENGKITRALQRAKEEMEREIQERRRTQEALEAEKQEQRLLIRKLEEAHTQLLQSEKLASIGQLAAGVAHEINNPIGFVSSNLGTLKGYVNDLFLLIDAYGKAEAALTAHPELMESILAMKRQVDLEYLRSDIRDLIAESVDGTNRVRRIVQDLRDFSRTGEEKLELADLHAGLESTLNVVWNEIKYKAEVKRELDELPLVECRISQISQVFMNLLVNAAQAIQERGTITLRSGRENDFVWVAVSDTGQGIPPEILPRIFDPFFTTKPIGKGTGLGLSVSYGIIEKHGGHIDVHSEQGKGTTFTVWLPIRSSVGGS